ncbi:FAD-binding domain-containing protein [Byssothecium circinans]|uniref:FAD-binding domain-containing protein n=1 Tax=Byssothecium circinans TaxID=147558 RepID=A0A6A5TV09_9PLEO|nr:FAD-binding domain-containing protein [Byssothecium circinans]
MISPLLLWIGILLSVASTAHAGSNSSCKCIPSDPCWPSATTWTSLNETLTGRVLPTELPKSVCPTGGTGSRTYIVNATNATHVQATLQFAREHNLKVNVNNTGHAGPGRSSTCGALFISTHYMKGFKFHRNYIPQSCSQNNSHMAATLGAGEQDDDVFQAMAKHNAVTVGGTFDTVGIVGWSTGGGHGWLTSSYGMGADNIFEVEMATPSGDIVIANECQNADIFWAIRGGGGGTFGVITRITMKAYTMPQTTQWLWNVSANNGTDARNWWKLVAELHAKMVKINELGFQGYYTISGPKNGPLSMGGYFLAYDKRNSSIESTLEPFISLMNSAKDLASLSSNITRYDRWIDAYNALPKQTRDNTDGPGGTISSMRLLTREGLTEDLDASARMFGAIGPNAKGYESGISSHILAGSLIASSKPVKNALNPAWRDTAVHMVVKVSWSDDVSEEQVLQFHDTMTNKIGYAMRKLSPDSGCYVNECDQFELNWQWAMYGSNYSHLRAIKAKYDMDDLFWCRRCIGSDEWMYDEGEGTLCRRPLTETWPNFAYQH